MLKRYFNASFANQAAISLEKCTSPSGAYAPLTYYNPSPGEHYAYANGALWADNNHSQLERLYLPIIQKAHATDPTKIPETIDLFGAEVRLRLCTNNLHLPADVRLKLHFQSYDPEVYEGHGTNVNYLSKMNLETALGYFEPYYRGVGGQTRTQTWVDVNVPFTPETFYPIDGNAAKIAAKIYGRSGDADDTIEQSVEKALKRTDPREKLLNMMIVMACGTDVPASVPMSGELYIRKFEVWAEDSRNTTLTEV